MRIRTTLYWLGLWFAVPATLLNAAQPTPVDDAFAAQQPLLENKPRPVYTLDGKPGALRFGDGQRGQRPPGQPTPLRPPRYVTGGAPAQSIKPGESRNPQTLRHRDRAVSASDFRPLAPQPPAQPASRATTKPRLPAPSVAGRTPDDRDGLALPPEDDDGNKARSPD